MPHPSAPRRWPQVDHGRMPRGLIRHGTSRGGLTDFSSKGPHMVAHIERMRLFSVQYAPPTHGQPQCGRGTDCHAHWLAPIKSCRRRSLQLVQLLWRRPPASMIKSAQSSLQGALSTGLPKSIDHTRPCTGMVQEVVNMIVTMGLRIKAQAPAAQRMTRMSFVLPPSCWRGWSGPY